MKFKAFLKNLSIVFIIMCVVFASVFCVSADDETVPVQEETQVQEVTDPVQEETDPPTEPVIVETTEKPKPVVTTEATTEEKTEATAKEKTEETTKQEEEHQEVVQENTQRKTLPTISKTEPETKANKDGDLTYGYASWACVVAGILVLAIVLISTLKFKSNR